MPYQTGLMQSAVPVTPTNTDCVSAECLVNNQGDDILNIFVEWNDNPGADSGDYTVSVSIEGDPAIVLTDATPGCSITEIGIDSTTSLYQLDCDNINAGPDGCDCGGGSNPIEVLEIRDENNTPIDPNDSCDGGNGGFDCA